MSSFKRFLAKMVITTFLATTVLSQNGFSAINAVTPTNETGVKRIIVKYKDESKADSIKNYTKSKLNLSKLSSRKKFKKGNFELLEIDDNANVSVVLSELKNNSAVEFAQEDYQVKLGSAANDTLFNEQWALKNSGQAINGVQGTSNTDLSAENAWDITKGNSDVVVAVLDTDLDISHEDLSQNIEVNTRETPNNGIDDDNNGYIDDVSGFDFANNSNSVYSSVYGQSHATHLAGIIAAVSNNNKGVSGISPNVKIMPLKFVNNGIGYTSDAIEAIQYAEANGAAIVNCSWWTSENNIALKDAISSSNMLFVTAAGNSGTNNDLSPVYPANFNLSNVISVAALDNQGNLASFSNYGLNTVDIVAPGKDIISTIPGNQYGYMSGTSMAAGFVSGVAALLKSKDSAITASQIKEKIKFSDVNSSALSSKIQNGRILNAFYALGGQQTPNSVQTEQTAQNGTTENNPDNNNSNINTMVPPQNASEYAIWKQNLASAFSIGSDSQLSTLGYSNGLMYNSYIEYYVRSNGRFTIGTTGGDPDNPNDNYKKLTYGHPGSSTSYTTMKIDGSNYIYYPNTQAPTPNEPNLTSTSESRMNNVSVKQELSIVKNTSTERDDVVQIKYIVKNNDTINHNAGVRIMLDTMLGGNDGAPFRIPGIGSVTKELELTGNNIPEYWQAFDNLLNPSVVSNGSLLRAVRNQPDKVQFAYWPYIYNASWDYTVKTNSYLTSDSAVAVYWNPKTLAPGETREYVTYYGLSELQGEIGSNLAVSVAGASSVEVTDGKYNPNPFTVTSYVMNTGYSLAGNVKARIDLPEGLKLAAGQQSEVLLGNLAYMQEKQLSWKLEILPANTQRTLTYTVTVTADGKDPVMVSRTIDIPSLAVAYDAEIREGQIPSEMSIGENNDYIAEGKLANSNKIISNCSVNITNKGLPWGDNDDIYLVAETPSSSGLYMGQMVTVNGQEKPQYQGNQAKFKVSDRTVSPVNLVLKATNDAFPGSYQVSFQMYDAQKDEYFGNKLIKSISVKDTGKDSLFYMGLSDASDVWYLPARNSFFYDDGQEQSSGSCYIMPSIGRQFAPKPSNVWYTKSIDSTTQTYEITIHFKWDIDIGGKIANFKNNLPQFFKNNNAQFFRIVNTIHVPSGWRWQSYDTNIIKGYTTHQMDFNNDVDLKSEIYKYNHVECDVMTDSPELLEMDKEYYVTYKFVPKPGCSFTSLDKENYMQGIILSVDKSETAEESDQGSPLDAVYYYNTLPFESVSNSYIAGNSTSNRRNLTVSCPVEVHVYDSQGRHLGPLQNGVIEAGISSGKYKIIGETKFISLADNDNYRIVINGKGDGYMNIKNDVATISASGINVLSSSTYLKIPVKASTIAEMQITPGEDSKVLRLDQDGDEVMEKAISPTSFVGNEGQSDRTPPVTSIITDGVSADNGWYKGNVNATLTAADTGGGSFYETFYSLDGSDPLTYYEPFTISGEGIHKIVYNSVDTQWNYEKPSQHEVKIDITAPWISIDIPKQPIPGEEYTISYLAEDHLSGLAESKVYVNGMECSNGDKVVLPLGDLEIRVTAVDNAGNVSERIEHIFAQDTVPPVSIVTMDGVKGNGGWFTSDVNVKVVGSDEGGSGIQEINYALNDNNFIPYNMIENDNDSLNIPISSEEANTLEVYSKDGSGNEEETKYYEIMVDKSAPEVTINLKSQQQSQSGYNVYIDSYDLISGIDKVEYMWSKTLTGDGEWKQYNGGTLSQLDNGNWYLLARAFDKAGNQSPVKVYIPTSMSLDPSTINIKEGSNNGNYVSLHVKLPENMSPSDIKLYTIRLNNMVAPIVDSKYGFVKNPVADYDGDGKPEFLAKFSRDRFKELLVEGRNEITITGEVGSYSFMGLNVVEAKK